MASTPPGPPRSHDPAESTLTLPNVLLLLFAVSAAACGQLMLKHG